MKDAAIPKREFDGVNKLRNLTDVCTLYLISNGTISIYTVTLDDDNQITVARESQSMVVDSECNGHSSQKRVATPDTDNKYFIFDLLNPVFGFSDALKNSSTPFSLMLEGSFFVEYDKLPPYADNEKVDAGDKQTNITTGNIKYTSSNNFWIDQEFVFENGAVILKQSTSNESLIRSQPFITLDKNDKQLNIEVFRIVDAADSVSGNGVSTINLHVEKENEEIYPSVAKTTIQISSDYPDAWQKYLSQLDSSSEIRDGVVVASFSDKSVKISVTDVSIMLP
jgi:hypothetical protein